MGAEAEGGKTMREIKFKYYCKDMTGHVFSFVTTIEDLERAKLNINTYGRIQEIIARCQYTGRKDKQDVEIYGGDVIKQDGRACVVVFGEYECETGHSISNSTHSITHVYTGWHAKPVNKEKYQDGDTVPIEYYCEVVGDAHQNPELLEAKP